MKIYISIIFLNKFSIVSIRTFFIKFVIIIIIIIIIIISFFLKNYLVDKLFDRGIEIT